MHKKYGFFLGSYTFFKDRNLRVSKQGLGFLIVIDDHVIIPLDETETSGIYYSIEIMLYFTTRQTTIIRSYCILHTKPKDSHPVDTVCIVHFHKSLTFWMLRSMLSGRLKRNLKRWSTLRALRVESALSFRPKTSWNKVSAVLLAPVRGREHMKESYRSLACTQMKSILPVSSAWVAMALLYAPGQILLIRTRPWTTIKKIIRAAGQIIPVFPTLCPALADRETVRHWGELGWKLVSVIGLFTCAAGNECVY